MSPTSRSLRVLCALLLFGGCSEATGPGAGSTAFRAVEIAVSQNRSCAITAGGSTYCWGPVTLGPTVCDSAGVDKFACLGLPRLVADSVRLRLTQLASGSFGAICALTPAGVPECSGYLLTDLDGGYIYPDSFAPLSGAPPIGQLGVGQGHVCGIDGATLMHCWGDYDGARRGLFGPYLGTGSDFVPNTVAGSGYSSVSLGFSHTCAVVASSSSVVCWGYAPYLGNPAAGVDTSPDHCGFFTPCTPNPSPVATNRLFVAVASGSRHTCGLEAAGAVYCWGGNESGQLGTGDTTAVTGLVAIPLPARAVQLRASSLQTCALLADSTLTCWGNNGSGLMDPSGAEVLTPRPLPFRQQFSQVSFHPGHACGITHSQVVYCWGSNSYGELGTGDSTGHATPVRVRAPA